MKNIITLVILAVCSFTTSAGIYNNTSGVTDPEIVVIHSQSGPNGSAPIGVINRDHRTDAGSAVLLGIVEDTVPIVDPDSVINNSDNHDVDHGLGAGLIINNPAYSIPPTESKE